MKGCIIAVLLAAGALYARGATTTVSWHVAHIGNTSPTFQVGNLADVDFDYLSIDGIEITWTIRHLDVVLSNTRPSLPGSGYSMLVSEFFNSGDEKPFIWFDSATISGDRLIFVDNSMSAPVVSTEYFDGVEELFANANVMLSLILEPEVGTGDRIRDYTFSGDISVTYHYTPIPEPSTSALALAGVAFLVAGKRRKK